ncbi:MAG: hypothetical protein HY954_09100 [Deltaproteobacteria bacterium]|nr:hypothetical protein [Deltaproteobacteria bacterium]
MAEFNENNISLLEYGKIVWKRKTLIIAIVLLSVFGTAISSLFMENIYQAEVIITPVGVKETSHGASALLQQFGPIQGISLPGSSSSSSEIVNLLKSKVLKEKIIVNYDLLPVLFSKQWDKDKGEWIKDASKAGFSLSGLTDVLKTESAQAEPLNGGPTLWDGLRMLDRIVKVSSIPKDNLIMVTVEFNDPALAARIAEYFIMALNDHMTSEVKRVARTNRKYLEEQLNHVGDPFIRNNIYNLIAQQIELSMMAEVKENFAFKLLDPPKTPDRRIKPKRTVMVKVSFVVAFSAGVALSFVLEFIKKARNAV